MSRRGLHMSEKLFGISENALAVCEQRAALITSNLVNASTPNYKAKDIDFEKALADVKQDIGKDAASVNADIASDQYIKYRIPNQKSLDGNTVDDEIERKNFLQNALRYQVNLTFVQNKSDELMKAIKGD